MRRWNVRSVLTLSIATLGVVGLAGCPIPGADSNETGSDTDASTTNDPTMGSTTATPTTTMSADTTMGPGDTDGDTDPGTTTGGGTELLERIIEGVGGEDNLNALETVQYDTSGNRFITDEGLTPGDPAGPASSFNTIVSLDLVEFFVRNDISRTLQFFPGAPITVSEIVGEAGDEVGGAVDGIESLFGAPTGDMLSDRLASTLKQAFLLTPHFLLYELINDPAVATAAGTEEFDGRPHDLLEIEDDIYPITLWIDQDTSLISRLTTMENSHLHRDTVLEVIYSDWQDTADGVLFPGAVQLLLDGEVIHDETRNRISTNPEFDPDTFELPVDSMPVFDEAEFDRGLTTHQHNQVFASIGIPLDGLQTNVMATELGAGTGVWHLTGGSHHSLVIEQENGVVVAEAPLHPQRCEAILNWIDTELMGAPVTHIVLSHHHEDHTACARVFVAAGATLVIHEAARAFFEEILAAPSTIEPDRLEMNPVMDPLIEVVPTGGNITLDDPINPVGVYELVNTHAVDMVFPFVESTGDVFIVDVYSPGNPALNPAWLQEILDSFTDNGVIDEVVQIAGGHGGVGPLSDLQDAANPNP